MRIFRLVTATACAIACVPLVLATRANADEAGAGPRQVRVIPLYRAPQQGATEVGGGLTVVTVPDEPTATGSTKTVAGAVKPPAAPASVAALPPSRPANARSPEPSSGKVVADTARMPVASAAAITAMVGVPQAVASLDDPELKAHVAPPAVVARAEPATKAEPAAKPAAVARTDRREQRIVERQVRRLAAAKQERRDRAQARALALAEEFRRENDEVAAATRAAEVSEAPTYGERRGYASYQTGRPIGRGGDPLLRWLAGD